MFEIVLFDNGLEQAVWAMVQSAFYSTDEIVQFFEEIASDDPDAGLDPKTVCSEVRKYVEQTSIALAKEMKLWPKQTDNDRLTNAFRNLNDSGIKAIENYGYMASDCSELYRKIKGNAKWRGYCFYHNQDLVRAVLGGGLSIRFSAALDDPSDDDDRVIAETVLNELKTQGLAPEWNGDPRTVIQLPIEWQRRP